MESPTATDSTLTATQAGNEVGWQPSGVQCPTCLRLHSKPWKFKPLYDAMVCPKCRNALANRRQAAYAVDYLIYELLSNGLALGMGRFLFAAKSVTPGQTQVTQYDEFVTIVVEVLSWVVLPLLFLLRDAIGGRSPGKLLFGVRVVDVISREPISAWQSIKRNLILMIPTLGVIVGVLTMMKGQRWGDKWAKCMVIPVKYAHRVPYALGGRYCRQCGYDLTGNTSGRCPECGLDAPVQAAAAADPVEPA